jgi:5-methylcytosine-specific restriction endonuclease McrA
MRRSDRRSKRVPEWVLRDVYLLDEGCCIVCGERVSIGELWAFHHVLPKSRWPELRNDSANIVTIHIGCHARHESAFARIKREQLPARTLELAERLGDPGLAYLDRTYPHGT